MGKCKDINNEKKSVIVALLKSGTLSLREIARREKVSHQSVMRISKSLDENLGQSSNKRQNCRGQRKTTPQTDRRIVLKAIENHFASLNSLHQELQGEGIEISPMTLRSRLYEANLKARRPVKKPKLTARMRRARLQWARAYRHYTVADFKKVFDIFNPYLPV